MACASTGYRATVRAVDGIHDLGGMGGFGPVEVERDEPVFHEPWEALRVRAERARHRAC